MAFNLFLHNVQTQAYDVIVYTTWFLYIVIALGLSANAPQYLDMLQSSVKIYVSLFLVYRFNPFRQVRFNSLDAKIAFSAGMFLLATTAIDQMLKSYLETVRNYFQWHMLKATTFG
jgi:hypothetical protein